jgi:hypothetical protein
MKRALKKNLKFERRWAILIDEYIDGDAKMSELDLGVLLICGLSVKNKMLVGFPFFVFPFFRSYSFIQ